LALTSPTSGGRPVGIVRLRTKDKEFSFLVLFNDAVIIPYVQLRMVGLLPNNEFKRI
jgi:hypothetical protein